MKWTPEHQIKLLKLMYSYRTTYGNQRSNANWWKNIARTFNKQEDKNISETNISRTVTAWIKDRKDFLELLGTGKEDNAGEYEQSIDNWIEVYDEDQQKKGTTKKNQEELEQEAKTSRRMRKGWTKTMSKRSKRRASTTSSEEDKAKDSDGAIYISEGDGGEAAATPTEASTASKRSKITATKKARLGADRRAERQVDLLEKVVGSVDKLCSEGGSSFATAMASSANQSFDARLSKIEEQMVAAEQARVATNNMLERLVNLIETNQGSKEE